MAALPQTQRMRCVNKCLARRIGVRDMRTWSIVVASVVALFISGCTSAQQAAVRQHCEANPLACAAIAAGVVGGVILVLAEVSDDDDPTYSQQTFQLSDAGLKTVVRRLGVMDNGLRVYSFRYKGDPRVFSGVLAQELLEQPEFAHAVVKGEKGFYQVDYSALGLRLYNVAAMREASAKALAGATSL